MLNTEQLLARNAELLKELAAKNRELEIEAALERVRSRSLAMHKSDELHEVVTVVFERMKELHIAMDAVNINIFYKELRDVDLWIASPGQDYAASFHLPYVDLAIPSDIFSSREKEEDFFAKAYSFEEKNQYFNYLFTHSDFKYLPDNRKNKMLAGDAFAVSIAFTKNAAISIHSYSGRLFSDSENDILKRFAKVFEQAYTRFLDLQKAEAQAREAQIEAALERVRSRTMAMFKSDELREVVFEFFKQMNPLGFAKWGCIIALADEEKGGFNEWLSPPTDRVLPECYHVPKLEHPVFEKMWSAYIDQVPYLTIEMKDAEKRNWDLLFFEKTDFKKMPQSVTDSIFAVPKVAFSLVPMRHGLITAVDIDPIPEDMLKILSRFAKVFEQTYTRFLDLQKVEAQAREAQIEAALERVRSRSMQMQKSEELKEVIQVVYKQFVHLNIQVEHTGFIMDYKERNDMHIWLADKHAVPFQVTIPYFDCAHWNSFNDAKEKGKDFFTNHLNFEEKNKFYQDLFKLIPGVPEETLEYYFSCPGLAISTVLLENIGLYIENFSGTPYSDEENATLMRFGKVFQQTYTRFLDLQKAEAQARESQIQLALERVRARTMAMQRSDELADAASLLFKQLDDLGIRSWSSGFNIWQPDGRSATINMCNPDGSIATPYYLPHTENIFFIKICEARQRGDDLLVMETGGKELEETYHYMFSLPEVKKVLGDMEDTGFQIPKFQVNYCVFFSQGYLMFITYEPVPEAHDIFKRFGKVFEQTYTRFLDLQKAETQARETQIELGLERVRARAMAMRSSEELNSLTGTLFNELTRLDFILLRCIIVIIDPETGSSRWFMANPEDLLNPIDCFIKYHENPGYLSVLHAWRERIPKWVYINEGQLKKEWGEFLLSQTELASLPDSVKKGMTAYERVFLNFSFGNFGGLLLSTVEPLPVEKSDILLRFAKVFEQTYTRFLDLQKAEAQAREAQIEAALERVRSKTMAMHNSNDVGETVTTMFAEFIHLGIHTNRCGILIFDDEKVAEVWTARSTPEGYAKLIIGKLDLNAHIMLRSVYNGWTAKESFYQYDLIDEDLKNYYTAINNSKFYPTQFNLKALPSKEFHSDFFFTDGAVFSFTNEPVAEDHAKIMKRFASVFGQTYRRYLDLQKAEAQARESQIQLALERVRARTMAMQNSSHLHEVIQVITEQLLALGLKFDSTSFAKVLPDGSWDMWISSPFQSYPSLIHVPYFNHQFFHSINKLITEEKTFFTDIYNQEEKNVFFHHFFANTEAKFIPEERKQFILNSRGLARSGFLTGNIWLTILNYQAIPYTGEENAIIKRFANVFLQSYTRFLDLQKAEAQAREAQIEAALERVRARTMAMRHSNELAETSSVLFQQIKNLGFETWSCGFCIWKNDKVLEAWMGADSGGLLPPLMIPYKQEETHYEIYKAHVRKEQSYHHIWEGESLKKHYKFLQTLPSAKEAIDMLEASGLTLPSRQCYYVGFFKQGYLLLITKELNEELIDLSRRFSQVFDLTYTRFLDLQKAETAAKEAVKQAALDRIRADIASMRTVSDLDRITPLIWNELTILGIPFIRCGVFIMNDEQQLIHTFLATPDGKAIAAFHIPYDTPGNIKHVISHWHNNKNYIDHWDKDAFTTFAETLVTQGALISPEQYLKTIPQGGFYLHFLPFLQGMLYVGNTTQLRGDEINLIQSIADAFSTAYARYEDFNKLEAAKKQVDNALNKLQATQAQLIQSEKMASLGELTAGIAHEIQNPLNFVNNFSEVNKEMIDEATEEIQKGNLEEAKNILNDIKDNEEKINHHGKRADAIVKGMLQHSRKSEGTKEPTDINALCDEYLRLSYHGLRAKDKSFNADFKTDFDKSIGKINVVPQDIGRVLLNLYNNAFYATNEKFTAHSSSLTHDYKPLVSVQTKKLNNSVEITVTDNGNGIPSSIKEKIFQPFFTTKPTGQGTGLGLSLSYDIIKAHGGEIKVQTKDREGSIFIIQLPTTV